MKLNYLRISLTDRCNLNCIYCRPEKWVKVLRREELLSFEEIVNFTRLIAHQGVRKVRLTGGEPVLRKDITNLVKMIGEVDEIKEVALSTNGVMLEELAGDLKNAGLSRVNVSLDTLDRKKFFHITGSDKLPQVITGIRTARDCGLQPVKVNVVILKGINDEEVSDFIRFALQNRLTLRFIEHMPLHGVGKKGWYVSNQKIKKTIEEAWGRLEQASFSGSGPARYFEIKKFPLRVGFISPVSRPFCRFCSRLRLSADGKIKPCLASDYEIDIKKALRGKDNRKVKKLITLATDYKARLRGQKSCPDFDTPGKFMFQMGG